MPRSTTKANKNQTSTPKVRRLRENMISQKRQPVNETKTKNKTVEKKIDNKVREQIIPKKQKRITKQVSISSQNFVICKMTNFENDYQLVDKLGEGSFGTVYRIRHRTLQLYRALKKIKKNPSSQFQSMDEIEVLKKLDHSNILKIYEFYESEEYYLIVTDIFQGRELFDEILDCDKFSEQVGSRIIRQVLATLRYTHSMNVAHRDIKPQNILVRDINDSKKFKIKIIDWGLGIFLKDEFTDRVCGTPEYSAPEVFQGRYSVLCDMWSLGVLTFVMLTGNMPFKGTNTLDTITQVKRSIINYRKSGFNDLSPMAKEFITKLIQKQPSKRMSAMQALEHPWITQFKDTSTEPQHLKQTLLRLKELNIGSHFGIAVMNLINNHYSSSEQKDRLEEIFKFLDTNGDGVLSKDELVQGYSKIYGRTSAEQIASQTFAKLDVNNNGSLEYSQFIAYGLRREKQKQCLKLKQAFDMFDYDKNGIISWREVGKILEGKLEGLYEQDMKEILKEVDSNKDSEIQFQQFYKFMEAMLEKVDYIRQSRKRESQIKSKGPEEQSSTKKIQINLKRTESVDQQVNIEKIQKVQKAEKIEIKTVKNKKK